jgi:tetratricopeptide (TPR) repeat protein
MRDDFGQQVKNALVDRVGRLCSKPDCRASTSGPSADPALAVNVGVAAHITAASSGGPRYDASLTAEERRAATNGIWLCQNCAKQIDSDAIRFPVELLRDWKRVAEEEADQSLGKARPNDQLVAALGKAIDARFGSTVAHLQVSGPVAPSALDAELEEVKQELDRGNVELARRLVERLIAKSRFTPAQRWRAQALLAGTYLADGDYARTGRLLVDAVAIQPDLEKARAHEAAGYGMMGDTVRAHELATAVLADYPTSAKALAIWIQSYPDPVDAEALTTRAGALGTSDDEVAIALAAKLIFASLPGAAASYARAATELDPDAPHGWLLLGQSLHQQTVLGGPGPDWKAKLHEAEGYYVRACQQAASKGPRTLLSSALTNRGILREMLGDHEHAEEDYQEAVRANPSDGGAAARYSAFLSRRHRGCDAVKWAQKAAELEAGPENEFLHAAAMYERNQGDDRQQAVEKCRSLAASNDLAVANRAVACALIGLCQLGRPAEARGVLDSVELGRLSDASRLTHLSRILLEEGDREQAVDQAKAACAVLGEDASRPDRLSLAYLLAVLSLDAEAIEVLEPVARPGEFDDINRLLLTCATRSERDDLTMRLCKELRLAGVEDRRVRGQEFDLLSTYDPAAALPEVRAHVVAHPNDRLAILRLALLEDQCEVPGRVAPDLSELPSPAEAHPATVGMAVLNILSRQCRWDDAVKFGYGLLRAHPDDPDVVHTYISLVLYAEQAGWTPTTHVCVVPDSAVRFQEVGQERESWVVIEPDRPNAHLNECAPGHHSAAALLGRRPGDQFLLGSGVQERTFKIIAVEHKYIFRCRECMESYQTRFWDRNNLQFIRVVHQDADGTERVDLSPFFRRLDRQTESITRVLDLYRSHPTPIHLLSTLIGRDLYETMDGLCSPGLGVRCWTGDGTEWTEASSAYTEGNTLVLEPTALFTLGRLELLDRLAGITEVRLAVTPSTFNLVRNLAIDHPFHRTRFQMVQHGPGQYGCVETPVEDATRDQQFRETIVNWVRNHCVVLGCPELAALAPERRHFLVEYFGRAGAESTCVATRPAHVLWTDDLTLAWAGRATCPGLRRTWSQAALRSAVTVGRFGRLELAAASARLIGWEYEAVGIDPEELHAAAAEADWSGKRWPFAQALRYFRRPHATYAARLQMALHFLARVVQCSPTEYVREAVFGATLTSMPRGMVEDLWRAVRLVADDGLTESIRRGVHQWLLQTSIIYPGAALGRATLPSAGRRTVWTRT